MELIKDDSTFKPENCWRGININTLSKRISTRLYPPVKPSTSHTVTVELPLAPDALPKPFRKISNETWINTHVHMPFSNKSLFPIDENTLRKRWEIIQEALLSPIKNSFELEHAIKTYNKKNRPFIALHYLFSNNLEPDEAVIFFKHLLPKIIKLALQLPDILQCGIPLLTAHTNHSITLSQLQIASLLANAFLCTFPRRNSEHSDSQYANYPHINFNRLFEAHGMCVVEKIKCLINYFNRVTSKEPIGLITYSRRYIPPNELPNWSESKMNLPELFISSEGMIENQEGLLQVDFANKFIGGGVLGRGGVQEEIRFVICPELIAAQLFCECLDSTEAIIISGVERYNDYEGYSNSFTWTGNHVDSTHYDVYRRRCCTVVAIDAMNHNRNPKSQYTVKFMERELNKAYVGFSWGKSETTCSSSPEKNTKNTVATGNWGCGAFRGDVELKSLLQIMAAGESDSNICYFTFGNIQLRNSIYNIYKSLTEHNITVGNIWRLLLHFENHLKDDRLKSLTLYEFLLNALSTNLNDFLVNPPIYKTPPKMKPISTYFKKVFSPDQKLPSIESSNNNLKYKFKVKDIENMLISSEISNANCISTTNGVGETSVQDSIEQFNIDVPNLNFQCDNIKRTSGSIGHREVKSYINTNRNPSLSINILNEHFNDETSSKGSASNKNVDKTNTNQDYIIQIEEDDSVDGMNVKNKKIDLYDSFNKKQNEIKNELLNDSYKNKNKTNNMVEEIDQFTQDLFSEDEDIDVEMKDVSDDKSTKDLRGSNSVSRSHSKSTEKHTQEMFSEDDNEDRDETDFINTIPSSRQVISKRSDSKKDELIKSNQKEHNAPTIKNRNTNEIYCSDMDEGNNKNSSKYEETSVESVEKQNESTVDPDQNSEETEEESKHIIKDIKIIKKIQRSSWIHLEDSKNDLQCDSIEKDLQIVMDTSDDVIKNEDVSIKKRNSSPKIRKVDKRHSNSVPIKNKKITDYFSKKD